MIKRRKNIVGNMVKLRNFLRTHAYFGIQRSYISPHYINKGAGVLKCEIEAGANLCMRNVYATIFDGSLRYMVDVKKPLFVDSAAYREDTNFIGMLKAAHINLVNEMKKTWPTKTY